MPEDIRSTISFGKSHMHYIKKGAQKDSFF